MAQHPWLTSKEEREEALYDKAMEKARKADLAVEAKAKKEDAAAAKEEAQYNVAMWKSSQAELKAEEKAKKQQLKDAETEARVKKDIDVKAFRVESKVILARQQREDAERKQREGEEYVEGKVHAEHLAYEKTKWEGRSKEVGAVTREVVGKPVGLAAKLGTGVLKGLGLVAKLKGIKTEDQMIKNKELYFMGGGLNPKFTPLGRPYDRNNPMELYFGTRGGGKMPEGAQTVLVAMQQGYGVEQLEVITGLSPQQLMRSIQYLKEKKLWQEEWE